MIPLGDRVLLKHLEATRDGIWLPPEAGFLQRGLVMEHGEDARFVRKGDVVMFKTDEAVSMRVPIEDGELDPRRMVPIPRDLDVIDVDTQAPMPDAPRVANEETLYLCSEPMVYLILERGPEPL